MKHFASVHVPLSFVRARRKKTFRREAMNHKNLTNQGEEVMKRMIVTAIKFGILAFVIALAISQTNAPDTLNKPIEEIKQ